MTRGDGTEGGEEGKREGGERGEEEGEEEILADGRAHQLKVVQKVRADPKTCMMPWFFLPGLYRLHCIGQRHVQGPKSHLCKIC